MNKYILIKLSDQHNFIYFKIIIVVTSQNHFIIKKKLFALYNSNDIEYFNQLFNQLLIIFLYLSYILWFWYNGYTKIYLRDFRSSKKKLQRFQGYKGFQRVPKVSGQSRVQWESKNFIAIRDSRKIQRFHSNQDFKEIIKILK